MTVLCGGGPSAAKPGFNRNVVVTSAAVEGALVLLGLEPLAALLGPLIAGETFDLTTFCTTDPPADPGLTATDILDVTNWIDPTVSIPALLKVQQWFKAWYWYQVCQCTSTTTPAAPTPSNPGPISTSPGLPTAPLGPNCWQATGIAPIASVASGWDLHPLLPQTGTSSACPPHWAHVPLNIPYPNPVRVHVDFQLDSAGSHPLGVQLSFTEYISDCTQDTAASQTSTVVSAGGSGSVDFTVTGGVPGGAGPPGDFFWALAGIAQPTGFGLPTNTLTATVTIYCAGQSPTVPQSPCCPPDVTTQIMLNQILGLATAIFQGLPTTPHSFSEATVHAGLSGSGNFALLSSAIGIRVTITTVPSDVGISSGDPLQYFNAGFITTSAAEGNYQSKRIDHSPQVYLLPLLTDAIHYTLAPGVVATVIELTRGP